MNKFPCNKPDSDQDQKSITLYNAWSRDVNYHGEPVTTDLVNSTKTTRLSKHLSAKSSTRYLQHKACVIVTPWLADRVAAANRSDAFEWSKISWSGPSIILFQNEFKDCQHIADKTLKVESAVGCCNSRLIYKFKTKQTASSSIASRVPYLSSRTRRFSTLSWVKSQPRTTGFGTRKFAKQSIWFFSRNSLSKSMEQNRRGTIILVCQLVRRLWLRKNLR